MSVKRAAGSSHGASRASPAPASPRVGRAGAASPGSTYADRHRSSHGTTRPHGARDRPSSVVHAGPGRAAAAPPDTPRGANLLVSLLFRDVPDPPGRAEPSGRARRDRRRARGRRDGRDLKWPNDLLVEDRKLAGILAERSMTGDVVVGIGLNVGWCPEDASRVGATVTPAEVLERAARRVRPAAGRHRTDPTAMPSARWATRPRRAAGWRRSRARRPTSRPTAAWSCSTRPRSRTGSTWVTSCTCARRRVPDLGALPTGSLARHARPTATTYRRARAGLAGARGRGRHGRP